MKRPTLKQLQEYALEIGYRDFDAEHFYDYNLARGWMVGKHPMKDWKAAVRTWRKQAVKFAREARLRRERRMPWKQREAKINELNRRKQQLIREGAPYWKIHEINMQLHQL